MCKRCSLNTLKMQRFACRTGVGFDTTVLCAPSGSPVLAKSSNTIGCHTKWTMNGTCYRLAVCPPSSTPQGPRVNTAELPSRPPDSIPPSVQCFGRSVSCISNFKLTGMALEQLQEVFGPLVTEQLNSMEWARTKKEAEPSSAPSDRSKASRTEQGKGRPWQPAPTNRPPWRKCGGKERHSDGLNLTYLIKALARLALQQETAINQGLLPLLFAAAQKWKKSQEEGATTTALRTTLFGCLIQMLHTGLKDIGGAAPTPFQTKAEEMKWLKDGSWCYQKWSPALGSLVIDEDRPPLNSAYQTSGSPATGTSHHPAALHDPPLSCHQTAGRQHDGGSFVL